ncbi:MurR/RpiR family transcriptional regulator [Lentzea sp. CA-135723]|uniref:MurR/RpiR family transcriptional regulator n=1 Tax=Lentzea sp. CA-135723 TaxID=3239950 RepID=UPI003D8C2C13
MDFAELQRVLQGRLPDLAAGQRRVAQLVLSDPEGCAFRTIGETARLAEVHESSLVRFAHGLGLSGWPALTALCRERLKEKAQLVGRLEAAGAADDLLGSIAEQDQANIARTLATIDPEHWEQAVTWLAEAPRVHVIGLRKCFSPAYLLGYLLRLVRRDVRQLGTTPGGLAEELRDLEPGDVLVGISIHRYHRDTAAAVEFAARRGLHVIALTDNASSPLARHAGACFYAESGGVTILRSMAGFVSLVQALVTATAVRLGARGRTALRDEEELLLSLDIYVEP